MAPTLWRNHAAPRATVHSDGTVGYRHVVRDHEAVNHGAGEYVRGVIHNGIESCRAILKRAHKRTYHAMSPKHLGRYPRGFARKSNCRRMNTLGRMRHAAAGFVGRRLADRESVAPNGPSSGGAGIF